MNAMPPGPLLPGSTSRSTPKLAKVSAVVCSTCPRINLLQHTVTVKTAGVRELHLDTREVSVSGVTLSGQRESLQAGREAGGLYVA